MQNLTFSMVNAHTFTHFIVPEKTYLLELAEEDKELMLLAESRP